MALGNIRVCDVYGTTNKTETYLITIQDGNGNEVSHFTRYLCPKALKRLQRFIGCGLTPPNTKEVETAE